MFRFSVAFLYNIYKYPTVIAIALPAGMTSSRPPSITPSVQEIISTLGEAESVFWGVLGPTNQRGKIPDVRTAAVSLALIQALQGPLGLADNESAILAANLLGTYI
jgi:hypothetical protein